MSLYIRLASFLKYIKKETVTKIVILLVMTAASVTEAFALARCVNAVFNYESMKIILLYIAAALAAIVVKAWMSKLNETYTKVMSARVKGSIRRELLEKIMNLGPKYQAVKRSGTVQSLITDGVEALESYLVNYLPQVIISIVTVSTIVIYIVRVDVAAGLIVLFGVLVSVGSPLASRTFAQRSCTLYWKNYGILNAQYIDTMQGMSTLKAFHASEEKGKELAENAWTFYRHQIRNTALSLMDSSVITLLTRIGTSVSVAVAAYGAAKGRVDIAGLFSILFLVPECYKPVGQMNQFWHSSYMGFSVCDQLFNILDEPLSVAEKTNALTSGLESDRPEIEFREVTFRYNDKQSMVLDKVSFDIRTGQTVAVVGRSGAGKSTVANLLLRFYDPLEGAIRFNGHDIRDYSIEYLRSKMAVVFQDTYLFYGTMRENISMADPDVTMEEIEEAARIANVHDFIMSLPDGYDTIVGERGSTVSGGEKQRIAIARALIKNAPILILDEATANVDAENEKEIQEALEKLMENRTSLVIAHRLSTIRNADKIIVLEDGHIVEEGKHDDLLANDSYYSSFIAAQKGFISEV